MDNPEIVVGKVDPIPTAVEYTTLSPLLNPWLSKWTVFVIVLIPVGLTNTCLFSYPVPPSITLISFRVFSPLNNLNLWIPILLVVVNPTVLIPEL